MPNAESSDAKRLFALPSLAARSLRAEASAVGSAAKYPLSTPDADDEGVGDCMHLRIPTILEEFVDSHTPAGSTQWTDSMACSIPLQL